MGYLLAPMNSAFDPSKPAHPHANSALDYATEMLTDPAPWVNWEYRNGANHDWCPCSKNPVWGRHMEYRRKPRTITINGIEVPEPVREPLTLNQDYYAVRLEYPDGFLKPTWCHSVRDSRYLVAGLIHLTEEAARKHAEALLSFTKQ